MMARSMRKQINILLLGETGVGKSTFVNAFANYLSFESLQKADDAELICHIPTKFTIIDDDDVERIVRLGEDINECPIDGQSATQSCRCYLFSFEEFEIRLIDAPGIGDTRGIEYDQANMENVLAFIAQYEEIHAICILLKPNNARLTATFEFCIKQLLCHLQKSASRNIVFVFTNSRATFYKPGDTGPALKNIIEQVKSHPPYVEIKYDKENRFSFDNEAFRFLVARKNGIPFSDNDRDDFATSWERSTKESLRMVEYIIGLPPHKVRDTVSVNEARRIILVLSKPLADIAENIARNMVVLKEHEERVQQNSGDIDELNKLRFIPIVDLELTYFDQPRTVCTGEKCREVYKVGDMTKFHYPKKCHDPCYLTAVSKEIVGDAALARCAAMYDPTVDILGNVAIGALSVFLGDPAAGISRLLSGITGNNQPHLPGHCMVCGCSYLKHMHIYYDTKEVEKQQLNKNVATEIKTKSDAKMEAENMIKDIEAKIKQMSEKTEFITKTTAMFAHFLRNNAIAPYNDAFEKYMKQRIENEEMLKEDGSQNLQLLQRMQQALKEYQKQKDILDEAMKDGSGERGVTADMIFQRIRQLKTLELPGIKISEILQKHRQLMAAQVENTQIVHSVPIGDKIAKWGQSLKSSFKSHF